jgi:hypothetical protein
LALGAGLASRASATVALQWESFYDSPFHGADTAIGVAIDNDDNIIVTGSIESIPGNIYSADIATVKYNPAGETLWARHGMFHLRFPSWPEAITTDNANDIYVVGIAGGADTAEAMVTIKYRPNGDTAWARWFPDWWYSYGRRVAVDAQRNVYAAGTTRRPTGPGDTLDFLLVKYDSSGNRLWTRYVGGPPVTGCDILKAMTTDKDGNVILTGSTPDAVQPARRDFLTVKFNPAGDTVWSRTFDDGEHQDDYPAAVTTDAAGNIYVCGASYHNTSYWDYEIVKYSPAGDTLFTVSYNNDVTDGNDIPCAIAVDQHQSIYVTGTINDTLGGDPSDSASFATVKFGPAGGLPAWVRKYRGVQSQWESYATALKLDRYGNVYVTGCSDNYLTGNLQQATVEYDAQGDLKWAEQIGGAENDAHARALALDSKGNVYVAGDDWITSDPWPDYDYSLSCISGPDVGVVRVIAPFDTIRINEPVTPTIMVRNYSPFPINNVPVYMFIGPTWFNTTLSTLAANDSQVVTFAPWSTHDAGNYPITAYTSLLEDREPADDTAHGFVSTVLPWVTLDTMPIGPKKKYVKDGGALAYDDSLNTIYAVKGNNTLEFYSYMPGQTWVQRDSVPIGTGRRKVKKGAAMVGGPDDAIYLAKGNRTAEFWAYTPQAGWLPKPNLPGTLKGNATMACAPNLGRIYLLPGQNTRQLWYYDTAGVWHTELPDMPNGPKNKTCKDGTSLAYDGAQYLYAIKGKTSEFYTYDVVNNVWNTKDLLPNSTQTGKKRTSGQGTAFAFAGNLLYALKGNNTDEFWCWSPTADTWAEIDSLPIGLKKKRVKAGAALTAVRGKIYALKGNGTNEYYMYNANIPAGSFGAPVEPGNQGQATLASVKPTLSVAPNPFRNFSAVTYSLPEPAALQLKLYDVTGRMEIDLFAGRQRAGNYRLSLVDPRLAAGVYFLKMRFDDGSGEQQLTMKVLIER